MSNVNTKIQDFYNKGKSDGINDCDNFIRLVAGKYGNVRLENGLTVDKFLTILSEQMSKHTGGSAYNSTSNTDS